LTNNLASLVKARDLLYMLTWRDIHVRYKQSIMGVFWSILMPGLIVGAGVLVRVAAAQWSGTKITAEDISAVMVRAVPWSFFIAGLRFATNSLIANSNLVTKIAFPKEVFPISAVLSNLFDFLIATAVVIVVMLVMDWRPSLQSLWAIPLMGVLVLFTIALSMILAAANLFFRDVKYLVEVFLTYAIFFTPVLYPASMLGKWQNIVMLNPIAPLLEGISNSIVLAQAPDVRWTSYSVVATILLLMGGYWLFKQLESRFAESI
jgi:lipopolysaccharide transport system permease protein